MPKATLKRETFFADPRAKVAVYRAPQQGNIHPHAHEFIEIVVVLSGTGLHVTNGQRHQVQAGDVLVVSARRVHGYLDTQGLNLINILINEEVFRETEKELGTLPGYHALFTLESVRWRQRQFTSHFRLKEADLKEAINLIDRLEEETLKNSEGGRLLARSWVILLIGLLARQYGGNTAHAPRMDMLMGRILSQIEQDVTGALTVEDLIRRSGMSQRTFLRRFREATELSPVEYIIRSKIRRAVELLALKNSGLSITEIAFRCGFQDSNYFSRQFRRVNGKSPRSYRQ